MDTVDGNIRAIIAKPADMANRKSSIDGERGRTVQNVGEATSLTCNPQYRVILSFGNGTEKVY